MNATAKGEDMSMKTFRHIIEYHQPEYITLGGGEPTLHPKFWEILGLSIALCESVWLATNGSNTKISLALAKMAKKGVIGCALSQDPWHDPIAQEVIAAFIKDENSTNTFHRTDFNNQTNDNREIRDVSTNKGPFNSGRCDFGVDGCACEGDPFVLPSGKVKQCGCLNSPVVGSVFDEQLTPLNEDWSCYKQIS